MKLDFTQLHLLKFLFKSDHFRRKYKRKQKWAFLLKHRLYIYALGKALHPSGVAKSSTSFGWGKGEIVTSAGWLVTLCDPIWHVSSRSGDGRPACKLLMLYAMQHHRTKTPCIKEFTS